MYGHDFVYLSKWKFYSCMICLSVAPALKIRHDHVMIGVLVNGEKKIKGVKRLVYFHFVVTFL